jgi:hypothetical protein
VRVRADHLNRLGERRCVCGSTHTLRWVPRLNPLPNWCIECGVVGGKVREARRLPMVSAVCDRKVEGKT